MNNTNEKENNLFKKLGAMTWLLHKYHQKNHHNHENIKKHYEKYTESRILALLKLQEEIGSKELMFILDIPKHHFEEALEKMKKEEYLLLTDSENDVFIKLTEKGRSAEIKNEKSEFNSIFDCLSEEEKENLNSYIDTIVSSLKTKFKNNSDNDTEFSDDFQRDSFHGKNLEHPGMDKKEFYRSFLLNHGMNDNFNRCGERHNSHRYPGFHGRHDMERRRHEGHESYRDFMFGRDQRHGESDNGRFDIRDERCGHGQGFHRNFYRDREYDKRCDMQIDKYRSGHGFPEEFAFFCRKGK